MAELDPNRDIIYPPNNSDRATGRNGASAPKVESPSAEAEKKPIAKPVQRQSNAFAKIAKEFIACSAKEAWAEIVKPSIKQMISDMFNGFWWGAQGYRSSGRIPGRQTNRISYSDISRQSNTTRISGIGSTSTETKRADFKYDELAFESKAEAEVVLESLEDQIQTYNRARVADFYDFIGMACPYTENNYGWTDLSQARILPDKGGKWYIDFPRPTILK